MVQIQDTLVSLDVFSECFCCDLCRCKGCCCVEGDAGCPVEMDEMASLEEVAEALRDELNAKAVDVIDIEGLFEIDVEGKFGVRTVDGRDCVFAVKDSNGTTLCSIDRAYHAGKTEIEKPLSCALYPIRLSDIGGVTALNYHRWEICRSGCEQGKALGLPLYQFLKEPLIRAFGKEWYSECEQVGKELKKQGYI
mgnify:CR=1 FL=1